MFKWNKDEGICQLGTSKSFQQDLTCLMFRHLCEDHMIDDTGKLFESKGFSCERSVKGVMDDTHNTKVYLKGN